MTKVLLQDILLAREQRVTKQKELLAKYNCSLVSFTMNIAGPVKTSPLIERGFRAGLKKLEALSSATLAKEIFYKRTGCEAYFAVNVDAHTLKAICTEFEEATPLGRLFDMDILDADGNKLDRQCQRGCIVCGAPGRGCAAGRVHSVPELQAATNQILQEHFRLADREQIADSAVQSLLEEVHITPKPGLVDRRNTGSHTDMDIFIFQVSANALWPYFKACVAIGQDTATEAPEETFRLLRQAGLDAEKAMYKATGGVNTHKGAIFTLGILCGSIGRLWSAETPMPALTLLLKECAAVGQAAMEDFFKMDGSTAGQKLFLQKGLRGIRGEVADGLPAVMNIALPALEEGIAKGLSFNDAAACSLIQLIARVEDSNLYHRGGEEGAAFAKEYAKKLGTFPTMAQIEAMDNAFVVRNLSPGGCADLLAATLFLHKLKGDYETDNPGQHYGGITDKVLKENIDRREYELQKNAAI